jgi:penicillin amidase
MKLKLLLAYSCLIIFGIQNSFAQTPKTEYVKGIKETVKVIRDQWGVNHIYAKNEADLFFTQGYCAAKDRLFQFEIWRRQATGTTAEIFGVREYKRDLGARLFKFRGDLQKELNHYHPRGQTIIEAYVKGVNSYIDEVNADSTLLPIEFKLLKIKPQKWTAEVVVSRHQGLLGNSTQELNIGRAVAKVGSEKVKDIMWFHPKDPNIQLDSTIDASLLNDNILELYNAYRNELEFTKSDITEIDDDDVMILPNNKLKKLEPYLSDQEMEGSNNWIVSGTKSESGFPMLANDPHRKIALPSLRYIVHLNAPGWNVIGGGEPTIPGISIGHNDYGAWGLTIFETDGEDIYVYDLNPNDYHQYWYNGAWKQMDSIKENFLIKNAPSRSNILFYTVHGPVMYIDRIHHKAYSMKCAWMEPGGSPYLASLRIDQATDWESFRDACSYSNIPGENMIWADKKGNIGWQAVGIVPIRKNFSGYVPVPGDGRYEWQGYLPIKERPHLYNPAKGFFATANNNVTPPDYKYWDAIGYTWADAFRADRINAVLAAKEKLSLQDMAALQTDYFSIPASKIVPLLKNIQLATPQMQMMLENYILKWDFTLKKESVAAGFYVMLEKEIINESNKLFIPESIKGMLTMQLGKVIERLENPEKYFVPSAHSNRDLFLTKCFEQAFNKMNNKFKTDEKNSVDFSKWQYGQANYKHISFDHPLAHLVDTTKRKKLNLGPLPRGGNGYTVGSTGSAENQSSGASFRILMDTKDWDSALMINTPGQSGDYKSPYYSNLFPLWANDKYFPAYFSKSLIEKNSDNIIYLSPHNTSQKTSINKK